MLMLAFFALDPPPYSSQRATRGDKGEDDFDFDSSALNEELADIHSILPPRDCLPTLPFLGACGRVQGRHGAFPPSRDGPHTVSCCLLELRAILDVHKVDVTSDAINIMNWRGECGRGIACFVVSAIDRS
jgi:hypothetical protein